jgi:hypothetical protein
MLHTENERVASLMVCGPFSFVICLCTCSPLF